MTVVILKAFINAFCIIQLSSIEKMLREFPWYLIITVWVNLYKHYKQNVFSTLRSSQNGRHFTDDTFKHIFLNESIRISLKLSLKFVPKGPINNVPALVQNRAWRRPGDKPLSEPVMVRLPTNICISQPQWVKRGLEVCNPFASLSLMGFIFSG